MAPVIDVHTHMLNQAWLKLLERHGRPRYTLKAVTGGHGSWTMQLSHYEPAPPALQQQLVAEFQKQRKHEED